MRRLLGITCLAVVLFCIGFPLFYSSPLGERAYDRWEQSRGIGFEAPETGRKYVKLSNVRLAHEGSKTFLIGDIANVGAESYTASYEIDLLDKGGKVIHKARDSANVNVGKVWRFKVPAPSSAVRFNVTRFEGTPMVRRVAQDPAPH